MTCVGEDCTVFHPEHVIHCNGVFAAGGGDENISERCCLFHFHDVIAVHLCFHGFDRIDFCHDDFGSEGCGSHGDASAAPAVADNYYGF